MEIRNNIVETMRKDDVMLLSTNKAVELQPSITSHKFFKDVLVMRGELERAGVSQDQYEMYWCLRIKRRTCPYFVIFDRATVAHCEHKTTHAFADTAALVGKMNSALVDAAQQHSTSVGEILVSGETIFVLPYSDEMSHGHKMDTLIEAI